MANDQALTDLKSPRDYIETRQHVFPSATSLKWFIRQHRAALNVAGALSRPLGRDLIHESKFDAVVVSVGLAAVKSRG
jgi:hypothetical protein